MKLLLKYKYIIIVLAVMLPRIAWFIFLEGNLPRPARDQNLYIPIAGRITEGAGISYSSEMGLLRSTMAQEAEALGDWTSDPGYIFGVIPVETPTASMEPGYPVLLALAFMLMGPSTGVVFFLNTLFVLIGALAVWQLVKENWGEKQALLAALIWSVYPYFVYYTAYAMTDIIHISLLPVILLLTVRAASRARAGFTSGLITGILFLVRSTAVFLLPLQLTWLFIKRQWRSALLLVAGFTLCCIPWVVRNQLALGSPILLPTKGSINLWMRNNPSMLALEGITIPGFVEESISRRDLLEYPPMDGIDSEIARNSLLMERAKQFIFSNPLLFSYLAVMRFGMFLSPVGGTMENAITKLAGLFIYLPLLLIAVWEAFRRRKDGKAILLSCFFILYLGFHSLVHGGVRYRLPVDTVLIILTSLFIGRIAGWREKTSGDGESGVDTQE